MSKTHLPIAVFPAEAFSAYERLLAGVTEMYGMRFEALKLGDLHSYSAVVLLSGGRHAAAELARQGLRVLAYLGPRAHARESSGVEVCFGESQSLSPVFHRARLNDPSLAIVPELSSLPGDEVVASYPDGILWLRSEVSGARVDLLGCSLPLLSASAYLHSLFCDKAWFALLPLLQLARDVSGWTPPPPRACFMFDDPNLHWTSYGYIDYVDMATHAAANNYHVAFATVPLDAWYTNTAAARLFQKYENNLSLLIHGNDHSYCELHRVRQPMAVAAQALRRIERMELSAGVKVSRVMAAPHGACSGEMATALLHSGFEAACISRSSLMVRNPGVKWPISVGLHLAEFFGRSVPIIPRFNIRVDPAVRVRLAMFLGQAVIPVGHHHDMRHGLEPLKRLAALCNFVAAVQWQNVGEISRSNYLTRRDSDVLYLRMYSRRIHLSIPEGIRFICVEPAWPGHQGRDEIAVYEREPRREVSQCEIAGVYPVSPAMKVVISARPISEDRIEAGAPSTTRLRAVLRRQLCEGRDRLLPTAERLLRQMRTSRQ